MNGKRYVLNLELSHDEKTKLERLAAYRRCKPSEALRAFIRSAQPGGSGWKHPSEGKNMVFGVPDVAAKDPHAVDPICT